MAEEATPIAEFSRQLLRGGKRVRAQLCWWGREAVAGGALPGPVDVDAVVTVAAALEVFHAAALVHDDLIDSSDTRRGFPSAHRRFERLHVERGYAGDPASFGRGAAILLGDLLQSWSDDLLTDGIRLIAEERGEAVRTEFERMRLEVTAGQYLDLVEERAWPTVLEAEALPRAERVILYKSAKYSVEAPLVIGAGLGGGDATQIAALRAFGVPLGIAFQLRDDLLGVFGDPAVTGKPAGDDLVEGKRTVLIAHARSLLPVGSRRLLDELLGDPELTAEQVRMLQTTIRDSGAVDRVEATIADQVAAARAALVRAPFDLRAREALEALIGPLTERVS
ncbi:MAG: geranylgeranyl pyrophosphate synthase [Naasia sp.]|nr:geranylgeranyl pyrophosphate synthase [Naasia sp.]